MEIRNMLISLLLVSLAIFGVVGIWSDLTASYGVTGNENISWLGENSSMRVTSTVEKLGGKIENSSVVGTTASESSFQVIPAIFDALKVIFFGIPLMMWSLISDVSRLINIPALVGLTIFTIVFVIVIFEIISAVLKYKM